MTTDTLCWHTSRHAVWDNNYKCLCNSQAVRVHEPAVWKEFNGMCNHWCEINKYRLVLPSGDYDQQALFLFAVQMLDLSVHKMCFGGCYICTAPYLA